MAFALMSIPISDEKTTSLVLFGAPSSLEVRITGSTSFKTNIFSAAVCVMYSLSQQLITFEL